MANSYNGWLASPNPDSIGINGGWEPVKGHDFPGGIRSGDVQTVFTYLVQQLHKRVEPIQEYPAGDEWGYYYRPNVNNPSQLSCHASGTAIDYNATQHPNRIKYTWTQAQTREIHKIINDELDGVIKWLEGWDEMHFEIRGSAAQVAAVAKKIRAMSEPPAEEDFLSALTAAEQRELLERMRNAPQLMVIRRQGSSGMSTVSLSCGNTRIALKTQLAVDQFKYMLGQPSTAAMPAEAFDALALLE